MVSKADDEIFGLNEKAVGLHKNEAIHNQHLRGYGKISANFWISGGEASILEVVCENKANADLTHAKYLSDISVFPGTTTSQTIICKGSQVAATEIYKQGWIAAATIDNKVYIVSATSKASLESIFKTFFQGNPKTASFVPQTKVPMWLDRWDRFGFRFYYRPWELPKDPALAENFNFVDEFDHAEKNGRSGLVFWARGAEVDTAEGMSNTPYWDWARREALRRGLPVGLNIIRGGEGSWFYNKYRLETAQKMPQFVGTSHGGVGQYQLDGMGVISWNSTKGRKAELAELQEIVRKIGDDQNITTILEPHNEFRHGPWDIFTEYGELADKSFQTFCADKYKTISDLNKAWGTSFTSWDGIRVPEIASFLGWGTNAIDLTGVWKVGYEEYALGENNPNDGLGVVSLPPQKVRTKGTPAEWLSEDYDDSSWPDVIAPGNDRMMFLQKRPAVYRRTFDLAEEWLEKNERIWLYVWDLNFGTGDTVDVGINGKAIGRSRVHHAIPHWGAIDVTEYLRKDRNLITLRLPKGILGYRVYLSPQEPKQYPDLGGPKNSQWVDFSQWVTWSRVNAARDGLEMIRQVDRNRQIDLMAPDYYADDLKSLAVQYGANFKNTGYMGVFYADALPALMRGAELPFSLEPGSPAKNLNDFKKMMGLYATEGIQGIDKFIHIGSVLWDQNIRHHFEENQKVIQSVGKYHPPKADVAALYATHSATLTGFPWIADFNVTMPGGYWAWNVRSVLRGYYESDAVTESSFVNGDASRYRVIIDTNTSAMDEKLVSDIERYVKDGGVFITFGQTGRHTLTEKDAWPISRLTGYKVTRIDKLDEQGNPLEVRSLVPADGQDIFTGEWTDIKANGLSLAPTLTSCKNLMLWSDGTVAIGMRNIGKGIIVQIGCKFTGKSMPDRIEPQGSTMRPATDAPMAASEALRKIFISLLTWRGIDTVADVWLPSNDNIISRHYLSNNGLFDLWSLWNQSASATVSGELRMNVGGKPPDWLIDLKDDAKSPVEAGRVPLTLVPLETKMLLTPRNQITNAALRWLKLQSKWWRFPQFPSETPISEDRKIDLSVSLTEDWSFRPLFQHEDAEALAKIDIDDSSWQKTSLGSWLAHERNESDRVMLRRRFTIPENWKNGYPSLWLTSHWGPTFKDKGRIWLDGSLVSNWSARGLEGVNPEHSLKPGTEHVVAVEIEGKGSLIGSRGNAWLWFWPNPKASIDLSGEWTSTKDFLRYNDRLHIPGKYEAKGLRRTIHIPSNEDNQRVVLSVEETGQLGGVLVNGNWVGRFIEATAPRFDLDITPWIRFGEDNEIEILSPFYLRKGEVQKVKLNFFDSQSNYP